MIFSGYRIGLVWSAIFTIIIIAVPRLQELQRESVSSASSGLPAARFVPAVQILEGTISRNATLVSTLVESEIPTEIANDVAVQVRPVFDVRRIHAGNSFRIEKDIGGDLKSFEYKIDDERT